MKHSERSTTKQFSLQHAGRRLLMLMLFLMGMNFKGKFFYWVFGAFFVWMFSCRSRVRVDLSLVMLLALAANLIVFDSGATAGGLGALLRPVGYVLCYVLGRGLFDCYDGEWNQQAIRTYVLKIFWVLTFGLLAHILLNFFLNFGSLYRNTIDIWAGMSVSATLQAALSCLPVAVSSAYLFVEGKRKQKWGAAAILVFTFINNLVLAGRTLLIYIALCLAIGLGYFLFFSGTEQRKKRRVITITLVLLLLLAAAFSFDLFHVRTMFLESNLYLRYDRMFTDSFFKDSRIAHKALYWENLGFHWWGGDHIYETYGVYAHDLYLDTYDYVGIIAFIGVCLYSLFSFGRMLRCVFDRGLDWQLRQVILSFYLVFHIEFWIEPILKGLPWFFALFCLLDGMIHSYLEIRHKMI